jgi:phenylpyruvate tautomerase PptA (4-oxalocrotonate tautomerase family)
MPFIQIAIAEAHDAATKRALITGVSAAAAATDMPEEAFRVWIVEVSRTRSALILPTQHETPGLFSRISALFGKLTIQPDVARHGHEAS